MAQGPLLVHGEWSQFLEEEGRFPVRKGREPAGRMVVRAVHGDCR